MTTPPTTSKAIAADPDVFLAWSFLIKRRQLPDHGLRYDPALTEQLGDGREVYTFDTALEHLVERDFATVTATYAGQPQTPLWTPN